MPYLPIDPQDLGREYESDVIRINSQSGKGGIAFILKQNFGMALPVQMREEVGYLMKGVSDQRHKELAPGDVYRIFEDAYIKPREVFDVTDCHFKQVPEGIIASVTIQQGKEKRVIEADGNGRLDAVSNALKLYFGISYELSVYEEHAVSRGSSSKAASYVGVLQNGSFQWGVGMDGDIIKSSIAALVVAVNKLAKAVNMTQGRQERIMDMIKYIQDHSQDVTLEEMSQVFHLSKPYVSKYIRENTGTTFQEAVKAARMKRARTLLKETNRTVESIAAEVGYETVEHFNRLFKKAYGMTPVQFRRNK